MCLLMEINPESKFSDKFLAGVYAKNSDGLGVMWAEDDSLKFHKILPKTAAEAIEFFRTHAEGKKCCVHWRMKTHGNIDIENCHPYPVFGFEEEHHHPMLLMHNGVLSSGNAKDATKSDTWHFIRDFLRPLLDKHPDVAFNPKFIDMLGKYIGSNRFALMDYTGRVAIVNRQQGVTYEGSWLSNTYAWDYYELHPSAPKYESQYGPYSKYGGYSKSSTEVGKAPAKKAKSAPKATSTSTVVSPSSTTSRVQQTLSLEVQDFVNDLTEVDHKVAETVTFLQVRRLLLEAKNFHDPWDLLEMFEWGHLSNDEFLAVMRNPNLLSAAVGRAKKRWRNTANLVAVG